MQQKQPQSKPVPVATVAKVPTPIRLTPEQLRQVSGAGVQQCCLPGKGW